MNNLSNEDTSDDEVFFGRFTLKEAKKRLNVNNHRQTICSSRLIEDDGDTSIAIIEQNSEPNIMVSESPDKSIIFQSRTSGSSETGMESFLKMEKMVSDLNISTDKVSEDLDNTMEVIDSILNSANLLKSDKPNQNVSSVKQELDESSMSPYSDHVPLTNNKIHDGFSKQPLSPASQYCTPVKEDKQKTEIFRTPLNKLIVQKPPTPANPVSSKKPSCASLKIPPLKSSAYQHIASPVAAYIKSPQVPLIQNVRPKKPLPGCSSIPKLVKPKSSVNKENFNLPSLAYKSAKTTKVIDVPEKKKLPQSHWAKKITSSLPKPLVLSHDRREMNLCRTPFHCDQEDSFADLSLHQADVSVCTQTSAFNKPNKFA